MYQNIAKLLFHLNILVYFWLATCIYLHLDVLWSYHVTKKSCNPNSLCVTHEETSTTLTKTFTSAPWMRLSNKWEEVISKTWWVYTILCYCFKFEQVRNKTKLFNCYKAEFVRRPEDKNRKKKTLYFSMLDALWIIFSCHQFFWFKIYWSINT